MADTITQTFPEYTGEALNRNMTPAEFNTAEVYYQLYHKDFSTYANAMATEINTFVGVFNADVDNINTEMNSTIDLISNYSIDTEAYRNETLIYKNEAEVSYQNSVSIANGIQDTAIALTQIGVTLSYIENGDLILQYADPISNVSFNANNELIVEF